MDGGEKTGRGRRQQAEPGSDRQLPPVVEGIQPHQLRQGRHGPRLLDDRGMEYVGATLSFYVGQRVDLTSSRADPAVACFLEGAPLAGMGPRRGHTSPPARSQGAVYSAGRYVYGSASAQIRASMPSSPHQTSGAGSSRSATDVSIFRGRSDFIRDLAFWRDCRMRGQWHGQARLHGNPRNPLLEPINPVEHDPMSETQALSAALAKDVDNIYKDGFPELVEPQTIPALAELAEALSPTPNDGKDDYCRQTVEALLRQAVGRLRPAAYRPGVSELLGLGADALRIGVRRDRAAEHFNRKSGDALRKAKEGKGLLIDARLDELVGQLVALAEAASFKYEGRFASDGAYSATAMIDSGRWRRRAPLLGLTAALLLVVIAAVAIHPWDEAGASMRTQLARLITEAERPLGLSRTPLPGETSSVLGFGDEIGGRPVYQYVDSTPIPDYPILDSFIDTPEHVGDERMFIRVETGSSWYAHRPHWTKPAAIARSSNLVFVYAYIANDAPEQPNCNRLVGKTIATNARIRLVIWNSPNNRLHVVRGWISADNAHPKWITDAAAVITSKAAPLSFDPADSWQYSISPSQFAHEAPLPNQDFFDAGGMPLSSNGLLGSCWANRWAMVFAFHQ
jgi:hypothetical protein